MGFAELSITSNFTFLTGGSHPEDYARRAALLGLSAIAIADVNSVAGVVRAWSEPKKIAEEIEEARAARADPIGPPKPAHLPNPPRAPIDHVPRLLPAACLVLEDGMRLTALPRDRTGWASLCRILSAGRLRAEKGETRKFTFLQRSLRVQDTDGQRRPRTSLHAHIHMAALCRISMLLSMSGVSRILQFSTR